MQPSGANKESRPPRRDKRLNALNRIGMELMLERDLPTLLGRILATAKSLTNSDGGGLFLLDPEAEPLELVLQLYVFDSLQRVEPTRIRVPISHESILGHAARIKRPVVVRDAYDLPRDAEYMLDRTFDERYRYRRRSMAFVPLVDHRDQLVGVMVLVNRKSDPRARLTSLEAVDRYVRPFSRSDVEVARSLGGQAAVAIENALLNARIERMMDSVLEVAATAVDERDPATAGHSLRVAKLSLDVARAVDATSAGPYRDVHFSAAQLRELRFAALLHDVGKLVVPEAVLLKAKKLPPVLYERVVARFDLIRKTLELERCHTRASPGDGDGGPSPTLRELDDMRTTVCRANEPSVVDQEVTGNLVDIAARRFRGPNGHEMPYITSEELCFLQLRQGTLDDRERAQAEFHAEATHRLLNNVLWTDELKNVVVYASGHHEKLDGSGYPRGLRAPDIPLQTQIVGLCDMFDALTQADRPYKPALSADDAFALLRKDAEAGRIDGELLRIMTETVANA